MYISNISNVWYTIQYNYTTTNYNNDNNNAYNDN